MTERIDITDHAPACIHLWGESALGYAAGGPVSFTSQDGRIFLLAIRPVATFSHGEGHLWDCLAVLAAGDVLSEAELTSPHLDTTNVAALRRAVDLASGAAA